MINPMSFMVVLTNKKHQNMRVSWPFPSLFPWREAVATPGGRVGRASGRLGVQAGPVFGSKSGAILVALFYGLSINHGG